MIITLDIPEAEFNRYQQYYKPWVIPTPKSIGEGDLKEMIKPLVMAQHFCEEQNCSLCLSAIDAATKIIVAKVKGE